MLWMTVCVGRNYTHPHTPITASNTLHAVFRRFEGLWLAFPKKILVKILLINNNVSRLYSTLHYVSKRLIIITATYIGSHSAAWLQRWRDKRGHIQSSSPFDPWLEGDNWSKVPYPMTQHVVNRGLEPAHFRLRDGTFIQCATRADTWTNMGSRSDVHCRWCLLGLICRQSARWNLVVVRSTGLRFLCYEPLIEMITIQSLWHIIIRNGCMGWGLNQ